MTAKWIAGLIAALCVFEAQAASWTNGQQIISAIIWKPGHHRFYVKPGTYHNPESCPNNASNLYLIDPAIEQDVQTTNRLFALISLALAQGKTVYVWVDGCQQDVPRWQGVQIND